MSSADRIAAIEAQLGALRVRHVELRRFRADPRSAGRQAFEAVAEIAVDAVAAVFLGDGGCGADDGDDPPGLEVAAQTLDAGRVVLEALHPLAPSEGSQLVAVVMRMAQRRGLGVRVDGHRHEPKTSAWYVPVADRMRRYVDPQLFAADLDGDGAATLAGAGWQLDPSGWSLRYQAPARPSMLRKFVRVLPRGAELEQRSMGADGPIIHELRFEAGALVVTVPEREPQRLVLDELFALGLLHRGWDRPQHAVAGLQLWTDHGPVDFVLPGAPKPAPNQARARAVAIEGWLWDRLAHARSR